MTKKRIERLRQEIACFEVFESRESYFKPVKSFEDERIAHLTDQINTQVTDFFVILVKNYVFALSFKERQLSGNGKIGTFFFDISITCNFKHYCLVTL